MIWACLPDNNNSIYTSHEAERAYSLFRLRGCLCLSIGGQACAFLLPMPHLPMLLLRCCSRDSAHADTAHALRGKQWLCDEREEREAGECQKFTPILRENTELWDESK